MPLPGILLPINSSSWPVQLKMCGKFEGKRVLDVGCGTGDKTRFFAESTLASIPGTVIGRIAQEG